MPCACCDAMQNQCYAVTRWLGPAVAAMAADQLSASSSRHEACEAAVVHKSCKGSASGAPGAGNGVGRERRHHGAVVPEVWAVSSVLAIVGGQGSLGPGSPGVPACRKAPKTPFPGVRGISPVSPLTPAILLLLETSRIFQRLQVERIQGLGDSHTFRSLR